MALAGMIAYGIAIEFLQGLVSGRFPSFGGAVPNTLGTVVAFLVMRLDLAHRSATLEASGWDLTKSLRVGGIGILLCPFDRK